MKRNAGVMILFAMLLTGSRLATRSAPAPAAPEPVASHGLQEALPANTSCPAFGSPAAEKELGSDGKITSLVQRFLYGYSSNAELTPGSIPPGIRFMFATVPDPLHTHLSMQFDRTIEAMQQALQDEGYTYDSSWLPWKSPTEAYSSLSDRKADEKETARRELCPGMVLFRSSMTASNKNACAAEQASIPVNQTLPYECGMLVFLISETPTAGLNQTQWINAQSWVAKYARGGRSDRVLRVLGPTFSGSMPSFIRALGEVDSTAARYSNALLYAGRIRGCASWQWLNQQLNKSATMPVRTADFDENDAIQIDRFYRFITDRGHALSEVAVLSEDETAYGGLTDPAGKSALDKKEDAESLPSCEPPYDSINRPVHLYYPRDISAVRSAYQEQSIFSSGNSGDSTSATHTVLQAQFDTATRVDSDSIEPFGRQGVALTQEAQLYGIVNTLRTHGIRFIILRSTNSLDYLFLTRFLHRAYPDAYMITMGTDMLFGRDVDSTEFRGVVALSAFPLLPRGQDWTMQTSTMALQPQHAHRIFGSDIMEGVYLATRFLTTDCVEGHGDAQDCWKNVHERYIHPPKKDIPDYAEPFWETDRKQLSASTWISVIGREGYWPLGVLKATYESKKIISNLALVQRPDDHVTAKGLFTLSGAWKLFCFLTVVLISMHIVASHWGWNRENLAMFVHFTPVRGMRHSALMAVGWATICSLVVLLFLASARMYPWLRGVDQLWVWLVGACLAASCVGALTDGKPVVNPGQKKDGLHDRPIHRRSIFWSIGALSVAALVCVAGLRMFDYRSGDGVVTAYRSVHLTSGISPFVSLLLMIGGFYWWFWQSLAGLSLLGPGKPILPRKTVLPKTLSRVSDEMADGIETSAVPFPGWDAIHKWIYLVPLFLLSLQICVLQRPWSQGFDAILHSLEGKPFNWTFHLMLAAGLYLLILDCLQLSLTWSSLKRLLLALNRLPLRRTFAALQGLSIQSLWSMSGTSSRARYKVFSHQIESLIHLRNQLQSLESRHCGDAAIRVVVSTTVNEGLHFIESRSRGADLAMANDDDARNIRVSFSQCTEQIINVLLLDDWMDDRGSLDLSERSAEDRKKENLPLSENPAVRLAEEFVCLIYVGYLQNMLGRLRTIVLSMVGMFAVIALSVAFYPYAPRPLLALSLFFLLLTLGVVVAVVYAGLDRDSTLSHITNTEPGNLGLNFWIRLLSFVGVPALGLIVAQFPEVTDFVSSWIQPTMNAVK